MNPSKTEALVLNSEPLHLEYNFEQVPIKENPKHLGLNLSVNPIPAEIPISKSRKTIYSLMGAGTHGKNGVNPIVSRRIWERYSVPRATHGLDVQLFPEAEMNKLTMHEI